MKTAGKFTKLAVAAAAVGAVALPASSALAGDKTERAIIGAVLGGVAGAALSNGDGTAVAVGAVAGAALGAATDNDGRRRYSRSYRDSRPYYRDARYRGYDSRYYGRDYRYGRYDTDYRYYGYR